MAQREPAQQGGEATAQRMEAEHTSHDSARKIMQGLLEQQRARGLASHVHTEEEPGTDYKQMQDARHWRIGDGPRQPCGTHDRYRLNFE